MNKHQRNLESYPLFYEELSSNRERTDESKKSLDHDRPGLSEAQLARLSDDLRTPLKEPTETNPLQ